METIHLLAGSSCVHAQDAVEARPPASPSRRPTAAIEPTTEVGSPPWTLKHGESLLFDLRIDARVRRRLLVDERGGGWLASEAPWALS
eukprot:550173-Prymnesium_polylepis.2